MKTQQSVHQSFVTLAVHHALPWLCALIAAGTPLLAQAADGKRETEPGLTAEMIAAWRSLLRRPAPPDRGLPQKHAPRVALGAVLFRDPRLSGARDRSCASCHRPELAFTDGRRRAEARDGSGELRNTLTLWNVGSAERLNWDGAQSTLQDQALGPMTSPLELDGDLDEAARRFDADVALRAMFASAFPARPHVTPASILDALAAYTGSLVSPRTRFDRWADGDDDALSAEELEGFRLFVGQARCATCHRGWRFTADELHDIGLPARPGTTRRAFKTPTLRALLTTGPYMHDGSIDTLDEVVFHYAGGFVERPSLSPNMNRDLDLADNEIAQLVAFLKTLSSPQDAVD